MAATTLGSGEYFLVVYEIDFIVSGAKCCFFAYILIRYFFNLCAVSPLELPPPPPAEDVTVYDHHGARLLTLTAVPAESLIVGRWHGHASPESVQRGAYAVLAFVQEHPECRVGLSDGTHIRGEWMELLPWICFDFLPQFIDAGMQAVAFVPPEDPATRLAITTFSLAARVVFPSRVFENETEARRWLATHTAGDLPKPAAAAVAAAAAAAVAAAAAAAGAADAPR